MIRIVGKILLFVFLLTILTVVTQVGGILLLLTMGIVSILRKRLKSVWSQYISAFLIFTCLYISGTFFIIPWIAKPFGRVPLPLQGKVKPLTIGTVLLNRHYVRPALRDVVMQSSLAIEKKHTGSIVNYLDGGFPFYDGFPLLPHLSHNDGRKLDIAFFYRDVNGNKLDDAPSVIGYGVYESPRTSEVNYPERCANKGFWQYGFMERIVSQSRKRNYTFDAKRTAYFVNIISKNKDVQKIFIEPHLKERLKLKSAKIGFHGCQAVRHDDHIHVQIY